MISDILADAVAQIQEHLADGIIYRPGRPLTERIERLMAEMDAVRQILDWGDPCQNDAAVIDQFIAAWCDPLKEQLETLFPDNTSPSQFRPSCPSCS